MGTPSIHLAIVGIFLSLGLGLALPRAAHADDRINAVIGDASMAALGLPPGSVDEVTRIRTHLRFVVARLRERAPRDLAPAAATRRDAALAELARYAERGEFPRRTTDGYAGRRPRFIDDRGVHCAVGHLVAASGAPELARAIAAAHEYDYVRDIRSPALAAWAAEHGFTLDELAMIQPEYGFELPPGPERTREELERATAQLALTCGRRAPGLTVVSLRVRGDRRGAVTATAATPGDFAACVAELASKIETPDGGRHRPYTFTIRLALPTPAALLERRMDAIHVPRNCAPRPGALARAARIDVRSDRDALVVEVTTEPHNAEVERCVEETATRDLQAFQPGRWSLHASRTRPIEPRFSDAKLRSSLELSVPTYATRCAPAGAAPGRVTVTASGDVDDRELAIAVDGGDAAFRRCVGDLLSSYLHGVYGVPRPTGAGNESYVRVDAAVHATVTVPVRVPVIAPAAR